MKRDVDLARQLLFDIEARGAECSFGGLGASNGEAPRGQFNGSLNGHEGEYLGAPSEVVRYHLRLLIDSGFIKEVDRTTAGVLCVRLTNSGHELIELSRSDLRWREAKDCCLDTSGGVSLTVIRALLAKWAVEMAGRGDRYRANTTNYRPYYYHRVEPRRRYEAGRYNPLPPQEEEDLRYVRPRAEYRESWVRPASYERDYFGPDSAPYEPPTAEAGCSVSLPVSLI